MLREDELNPIKKVLIPVGPALAPEVGVKPAPSAVR
jgi:hypothetical protein